MKTFYSGKCAIKSFIIKSLCHEQHKDLFAAVGETFSSVPSCPPAADLRLLLLKLTVSYEAKPNPGGPVSAHLCDPGSHLSPSDDGHMFDGNVSDRGGGQSSAEVLGEERHDGSGAAIRCGDESCYPR